MTAIRTSSSQLTVYLLIERRLIRAENLRYRKITRERGGRPVPARVRTGRRCPFRPLVLSANGCALCGDPAWPDLRIAAPVAQPQRRTLTPFTTTVLQTTAGLRTTTAPRAPAQPAR